MRVFDCWCRSPLGREVRIDAQGRLALRSQPTGPAPTCDQLAVWRSGWHLPPIGDANCRAVAAFGGHSTTSKGPGLGE